jgi:hypothetical protein
MEICRHRLDIGDRLIVTDRLGRSIDGTIRERLSLCYGGYRYVIATADGSKWFADESRGIRPVMPLYPVTADGR